MENRKFICSSNYFSGFSVRVNLTHVNTIDDIINIFKNKLFDTLKNHNFEILIEVAKKKNFHIHDYTIEDILTSSPNDYFYICDHC